MNKTQTTRIVMVFVRSSFVMRRHNGETMLDAMERLDKAGTLYTKVWDSDNQCTITTL